MVHASWRSHPSNVGAPAQLRPWLTDEASLTARIKSRCQLFQVEVLREAIAPSLENECLQVDLRRGAYAWVREVLLLADDRPVVFAHTVVARRDLRVPWHMAAVIGRRPLGEALFADPAIERGPIYVARIAKTSPLHRHTEIALGAELPTLWARRSRFLRFGRPLLVMEVFLPGIECLSGS